MPSGRYHDSTINKMPGFITDANFQVLEALTPIPRIIGRESHIWTDSVCLFSVPRLPLEERGQVILKVR